MFTFSWWKFGWKAMHFVFFFFNFPQFSFFFMLLGLDAVWFTDWVMLLQIMEDPGEMFPFIALLSQAWKKWVLLMSALKRVRVFRTICTSSYTKIELGEYFFLLEALGSCFKVQFIFLSFFFPRSVTALNHLCNIQLKLCCCNATWILLPSSFSSQSFGWKLECAAPRLSIC